MPNPREGASSKVAFALKKDDGTAIAKSDLSTLTAKLYDVATGQVINSRDYTSILDTNGGAVAEDGTGTLFLSASDNVVVDRNRAIGEEEEHALVVKFTASGGIAGNDELRFSLVKVA